MNPKTKKALRIGWYIIIGLSLLIYAIVFFSKPKSYEVDKNHHVHYKGDGVTEEDAKKTGDYFKQIGLFTPSNTFDVLIESEEPGKEVILSYVIDKSKITTELENTLLSISGPIITSVFNGRKVKVTLIDEKMNEIKDLGYASDQTTPAIN